MSSITQKIVEAQIPSAPNATVNEQREAVTEQEKNYKRNVTIKEEDVENVDDSHCCEASLEKRGNLPSGIGITKLVHKNEVNNLKRSSRLPKITEQKSDLEFAVSERPTLNKRKESGNENDPIEEENKAEIVIRRSKRRKVGTEKLTLIEINQKDNVKNISGKRLIVKGFIGGFIVKKNDGDENDEDENEEEDEYCDDADKPCTCKYCGKSFKYPSGLKAHELIHSGRLPFACKHCKKSFNQKSHLKRHNLTHKKTDSKPFKCPACDKCFRVKYSLDVHELVHSGHKPHKCDKCEKCFTQKSHLNTHKKIHLGVKEPLYT